MDKTLIKAIVYCPYKDCSNYNKPGNNIKILSLKNNRFTCKVCNRTFKFEIKYHLFVKEHDLDVENNVGDLKLFLRLLLDEYKESGKLDNLWPKLVHSQDPLIQKVINKIEELVGNIYQKLMRLRPLPSGRGYNLIFDKAIIQ